MLDTHARWRAVADDEEQVQVTIAAEHQQGTGVGVVRGSTWAMVEVRQQGLPRTLAAFVDAP